MGEGAVRGGSKRPVSPEKGRKRRLRRRERGREGSGKQLSSFLFVSMKKKGNKRIGWLISRVANHDGSVVHIAASNRFPSPQSPASFFHIDERYRLCCLPPLRENSLTLNHPCCPSCLSFPSNCQPGLCPKTCTDSCSNTLLLLILFLLLCSGSGSGSKTHNSTVALRNPT
jgi:hypothetical protein